jgi:hypothetical protein
VKLSTCCFIAIPFCTSLYNLQEFNNHFNRVRRSPLVWWNRDSFDTGFFRFDGMFCLSKPLSLGALTIVILMIEKNRLFQV